MDTKKSKRKYALVTGASRGIGRAACVKLATMGYHVLVNYRSSKKEAEETLRQVLETGVQGELIQFDVSNGAEVNAAMEGWAARNTDAIIEVLINNAGYRKDNLFMWINEDEWTKVINTNINGFYFVSKNVVKQMILQRYGRIINIVSASGLFCPKGQTHYATSKAGLIAATKSLAKEVGRRNITVNAIAPGYIRTQMIADVNEEAFKKTIPLNRFGRPEEVADLIGFLVSEEAAYITGEVISIDGGGVCLIPGAEAAVQESVAVA